jgi:hypothetical protein
VVLIGCQKSLVIFGGQLKTAKSYLSHQKTVDFLLCENNLLIKYIKNIIKNQNLNSLSAPSQVCQQSSPGAQWAFRTSSYMPRRQYCQPNNLLSI